MRRFLCWLSIVPLLAAPRAVADEDPVWRELVRGTAVAFARPGELESKRRFVRALAESPRPEAWVLILAALEREGMHLERLAAARADAWRHAQTLWSLPRPQHHERHKRRLVSAFEDLGNADRRWFRERMLVGQIGARLRSAPPLARALFGREATAEVALLHPTARAAMATLLATDLEDPDGIGRFRRLLERDEDPNVRLAALAALPERGSTAELMVTRRLRDRSWVVRMAAARLLAKRGWAKARPMLEKAMRRAGPREALVHRSALRELGIDAPATDPGPVALYDAPLPSKHVAFVLDASAAMAEHIDEARAAIAEALRALPEDGSFSLVVFHGAVMHWRAAPVAASQANKDAAIAWLGKHEAGWIRCLGGALREAFRQAGMAPHQGGATPIDTIAVVVAGPPQAYAGGQGAPLREGSLERLVNVWNRDARIRIQIVALGAVASDGALATIARQHDGALHRR